MEKYTSQRMDFLLFFIKITLFWARGTLKKYIKNSSNENMRIIKVVYNGK